MKMLSRIVLAALAVSATPVVLRAQVGSPGAATEAASVETRITPASAKPGEAVKLEVTVSLQPGYHTYDIEQPEFPAVATRITVDKTDALIPSGRWTGTPPHEKDDEVLGKRIHLHVTSPTWAQELRVPANLSPGRHTVSGTIRFQVCDDKGCLPPREEKFQATVELVAAAGTTGTKPAAPATARSNPNPHVRFKTWIEPAKVVPGGNVELNVRATLDPKWHIYSITMKQAQVGPRPTVITLSDSAGFESRGGFRTTARPKKVFDRGFEMETEYHEGEVTWTQTLRVPKNAEPDTYTVNGSIQYQLCDDKSCLPPATESFEAQVAVSPQGSPGVSVPAGNGDGPAGDAAASPTSTTAPAFANDRESLLTFLTVAVIAGLASILTPCVFPMIPITVGFFLKQSQSRNTTPIVMAIVYCVTIVAAFTLLGATLGRAFVELGSKPWFNALVSVVLVLLALALLGVFELRVPMFLVQFTSTREARGGAIGLVFMALTFVVMSTPCTGPFVGQVLVWSSQGEWTWPILGLIAYSGALSSPFFLLALAPGMLARMPKAGGWLNAIKVVMGLVVLATTFYFLVKLDLAWQTGLITRSLVLSAWAALAIAAALYLAGLVRLEHDGPAAGVSVTRLISAVVFLAVGLYFTAGLLGRPLNSWVEAIVPADESLTAVASGGKGGTELRWVDNSFEKALVQAQVENRPVFLDFTGLYCTNCKLMERDVFPRPAVVERFNQMVLAKLYTDRGTPEDDANQKLQQERFGTVALPFYAVLSPDGRELAKLQLVRLPSEREFVAFLDASLQQWAALKSAQPAGDAIVRASNGNPEPEIRRSSEAPPVEPASYWQAFDLARATALRAERRNLIVDWTAEW